MVASAEFDIKLPKTVLRANMPVKVGDDLLLSGELRIGASNRILLVTSMPMAQAENAWAKMRGIAASYPGIPHQTRVKRPDLSISDLFDVDNTGALDIADTEGIFDDAMRFIQKSPIASSAKSVLSLIPGVGPVANAAFMAADIAKMAAKALPPGVKLDPKSLLNNAMQALHGKNTKRIAQGKKPLPVKKNDIVRATKALTIVNAARGGNQAAQNALGKSRLTIAQPGSDAYEDNLALDAANFADDESDFADAMADEAEGFGLNESEYVEGVAIGDWKKFLPKEITSAADLDAALRRGKKR